MLNVEVYKSIFISDLTILTSVYLVVHTGYMHVAIKLIVIALIYTKKKIF